jgi:hypothetical protein
MRIVGTKVTTDFQKNDNVLINLKLYLAIKTDSHKCTVPIENRHHHFNNNALFINFKFSNPKPPYYFGVQIIDQRIKAICR